MKKLLLGAGLGFASLAIFYGSVSALVNKGFSLSSAIISFLIVVIGGFLLIWYMKPDS